MTLKSLPMSREDMIEAFRLDPERTDVDEVIADTQVKPIKAEDYAIALVKYASGAIGQFEVSWCFRGGMNLRDEVMGVEGSIFLNHFLRTGVLQPCSPSCWIVQTYHRWYRRDDSKGTNGPFHPLHLLLKMSAYPVPCQREPWIEASLFLRYQTGL
jgi:predicted dehydrogenase